MGDAETQGRSTLSLFKFITNQSQFRRFVKDKLFRDWGITLLSQDWYWVKCDVHGEPIFDMAGQHRRPYEGPHGYM